MTRNLRQDKRTTVSLARIVWEMAAQMMDAKGFNDNFSAYVADLIRRDKERADSGLVSSAKIEAAASKILTAALHAPAAAPPTPPTPAAPPAAAAPAPKAKRKPEVFGSKKASP